MKIFGFAAAFRKDSFNRKLISQVADALKSQGSVSFDLGDFREFEMPIYDGDLEEEKGVPAGAEKLAARMAAADAVIISTPEYNGGIPGTLKNAIDWVSRLDTNPLDGKQVLLIGASPGALGAVRGLWHTRVPFEAMGAFVYPEMFGLPKAAHAFKADGSFEDPKTRARLEELLTAFIEYIGRSRSA
jgi:NAD(P)H-dependent FMN reductase